MNIIGNNHYSIEWTNAYGITPKSYTCGFCGHHTGPNMGFSGGRKLSSPSGQIARANAPSYLYICTYCNCPTFFPGESTQQIPESLPGTPVGHLPELVNHAFEEARKAFQAQAYTACVLMCRKLLMSIAVEKGAKEGEPFTNYVNFLETQHYVPPNSTVWVDKIRTLGNEATHKIAVKSKEDAKIGITFVELVLKFIYEFPAIASV